ncbi:MAG TPA: pyridoxamine 5'-phosphate oxidase family protein [Solirubrobacter sp.]|nr:pyridoxamine 5'-phosphate oxidase family protein [Solirubrobacter sp.]
MSKRAAIAMSDAEVREFLSQERVVTCATIGRDGWPHLMPLWYVVRNGELWAWTYAKSQKVRNLERDARCTLQVESGDSYFELRGVMMKCAAAIHREPDVVRGVGLQLAVRYGGADAHVDERQAAKRVALQFIVNQVASFDHRKLG